MRSSVLPAIAIGLLLWGEVLFAQDVLFQQPHLVIENPVGATFHYSNQLPTHPEEPDTERSRAFDNFSLSFPADITEIRFSGAFDGPFKPRSPRTPLDFWIEIYPDDGSGRPALDQIAASWELDAGQAGTDDGTDISSRERSDDIAALGASVVDYRTRSLEPAQLDAGDYWMSIVAIQTFPNPDPITDPINGFFDPAWGWHFGAEGREGDGSFAFDALRGVEEPGASSPYNLSFAILGSEAEVPMVAGDLDGNSIVDAMDIDLLTSRIREGSMDAMFDVNMDGSVNQSDVTSLVEDTIGTFTGDANLDLVVDTRDFLALSRNFNMMGGWSSGDFDGSGTITVQDFLQLSRNFNRSGGMMAATVPEPGGLAAIGLVLLVVGTNRRRRSANG